MVLRGTSVSNPSSTLSMVWASRENENICYSVIVSIIIAIIIGMMQLLQFYDDHYFYATRRLRLPRLD